MGLSREQRRSEQLWWTRDLIEDLIVEKSPGFLGAHPNTDDLIKSYEPEILSVFSDIADKIIESVKEPSAEYVVYLDGTEWARVGSEAEAKAIVASYDGELNCWYEKDEYICTDCLDETAECLEEDGE